MHFTNPAYEDFDYGEEEHENMNYNEESPNSIQDDLSFEMDDMLIYSPKEDGIITVDFRNANFSKKAINDPMIKWRLGPAPLTEDDQKITKVDIAQLQGKNILMSKKTSSNFQ